jgi:hypothetical protein
MTEEPSGDLVTLRTFRCPLGHRSYQTGAGSEIRFRRPFNGDTWHFSTDCSQWPVMNFSSISYISSEATICNECLAKGWVTI